MRNNSVLGRGLGRLFGLVLPALLGAAGCQGSTTANDPNYHPVDSRRGLGNPLMGTVCDSRNLCATETGGTAARCVSPAPYTTVGFCAPKCSTDSDCDTALPGLAKCTNMGSAPECVLFCDQQHVNSSKVCPDKWSCQAINGAQQAYYMCIPPQAALAAPDGGA